MGVAAPTQSDAAASTLRGAASTAQVPRKMYSPFSFSWTKTHIDLGEPLRKVPGLSVSAWLYLEHVGGDPKSQSNPTINTVLANKRTGCDRSFTGGGFALGVNSWY